MKTRSSSPQIVQQLIVRGLSAGSTRGQLTCASLRLACALGRAGRRPVKREGDGATPVGRFALRKVYYRPDRVGRPRTLLPVAPLQAHDGWCDDAGNRNYNKSVRHPYPASAEPLWRADRLYDVIVVLGHNERPRVRGLGSAVFMHVAADDYAATAGCIALRLEDLLRVLERASPRTAILITA